MTEFEKEVVAGFARVETKVDLLTERFDDRERAYADAKGANDEFRGRVLAHLESTESGDDGTGHAPATNGDRLIGKAIRKASELLVANWLKATATALLLLAAGLAARVSPSWVAACVPITAPAVHAEAEEAP